MKEITYAQAVCEALDEEMERDDMVMMIGEDVGFIGGNFKTSVGLLEKYGDLRMKDSPISEQGIVGMGVGMALTGMRPPASSSRSFARICSVSAPPELKCLASWLRFPPTLLHWASRVETAVRVSSPPPATMTVFSILTLWMARRMKVERER